MATDIETLRRILEEGFARQHSVMCECRDELKTINGAVRTLEKDGVRRNGEIDALQKQSDDHEDRLRRQENKTWWFAGLSALAGSVSGTITNLFQG